MKTTMHRFTRNTKAPNSMISASSGGGHRGRGNSVGVLDTGGGGIAPCTTAK